MSCLLGSIKVNLLGSIIMSILKLSGPAIGRYPIRYILPEFVSYLGERDVLFVGNG